MKKNIVLLILFFAITTTLINSCKKDEESTPAPVVPPVTTARDAAVLDYNTNYLGTNLVSSGWTGSAFSCTPGTIPPATNAAIIKRINYFRRMVGLNDNCTLDTTMYAEEQQTALMMDANSQLSHTPPNTWSCWTTTGSSGAGSSNLALGAHSTGAITLFINDFGASNFAVGHRRWLFHSPKTVFSCGSTNNAMAVYVFGAGGNTTIPSFIAYPPKGYVPQQLVFARWSFSIPGADFSLASVVMSGPSGSVPLTINSIVNGYGDNTIVWEPTGINTSSTSDVNYTVTISGISGATNASYTYNVTVIRP